MPEPAEASGAAAPAATSRMSRRKSPRARRARSCSTLAACPNDTLRSTLRRSARSPRCPRSTTSLRGERMRGRRPMSWLRRCPLQRSGRRSPRRRPPPPVARAPGDIGVVPGGAHLAQQIQRLPDQFLGLGQSGVGRQTRRHRNGSLLGDPLVGQRVGAVVVGAHEVRDLDDDAGVPGLLAQRRGPLGLHRILRLGGQPRAAAAERSRSMIKLSTCGAFASVTCASSAARCSEFIASSQAVVSFICALPLVRNPCVPRRRTRVARAQPQPPCHAAGACRGAGAGRDCCPAPGRGPGQPGTAGGTP